MYTFVNFNHRFVRNRSEINCEQLNMVRCLGTDKCIAHRQIMDGIPDCVDAFDKSPAADSCASNDLSRFSCTSEKKCLSPILVNDHRYQCTHGEDERYSRGPVWDIEQMHFSAICDGFIDMHVNSYNETDETDCEQWPCSNQYTRCNTLWSCPRGEDELDCSSVFRCSPDHHLCFFPNELTMACLYVNRTLDGTVNRYTV